MRIADASHLFPGIRAETDIETISEAMRNKPSSAIK